MFGKFCDAFLYCFASLLFASIAGIALLMAVYSIPNDKISKNVKESFMSIQTNPDYLNYGIIKARPDYYTDFLILNIASLRTTSSPFEASILAPRYAGYKHIDLNLAVSLMSDIAPQSDSVASYPRYWHGYLVMLKPLLLFFNINIIRGINYTLQTMLLAFALFLLYKRLNMGYSLALLCPVLLINPISAGFCFQYSVIYYILLVSMIVLLMKHNQNNWKIFFWTGVATAFFDLLTYPLVPVGFLMIVSLALYDMPLLKNVICCAKRGFAWLGGYFGMWFCKWWIASIYTGENIFLDAYIDVSDRTFGDGLKEGVFITDPLAGIKTNWELINHTSVWLSLLLFVVLIVAYALVKKKRWKLSWKPVLIALVGLAPFVWYLVVREHSVVHPYIAYRLLAIAFFAATASVAACITDKEKAAD